MLSLLLKSASTFFKPCTESKQDNIKNKSEIKLYGLVSWSKYNLNRTLAGNRDKFGQIIFDDIELALCGTFEEAERKFDMFKGTGSDEKDGYLLEFACTKPQLLQLAKDKKFSLAIEDTYNIYKLLCGETKEEVRTHNDFFSASELEEALAKSEGEAATTTCNCGVS